MNIDYIYLRLPQLKTKLNNSQPLIHTQPAYNKNSLIKYIAHQAPQLPRAKHSKRNAQSVYYWHHSHHQAPQV